MIITLNIDFENTMELRELKAYLEAKLIQIVNELPIDPTRDAWKCEIVLQCLSGKHKELPASDVIKRLCDRGEFIPPERKPRRPMNANRAHCFDVLKTLGWHTTTVGWPTFFAAKRGAIALVTVKSSRGRRLRQAQEFIVRALSRYQVPCYRWDPKTSFTRIGLPCPQEGAEADDSHATIRRTDLDLRHEIQRRDEAGEI